MDIAGMLANYDALVGVALGAGLTYGFGALSRRHAEKREDATRWHQVRLETYKELIKAFVRARFIVQRGGPNEDERDEIMLATLSAASTTSLVGSEEVMEAVVSLMQESTRFIKRDSDESRFREVLTQFEAAARKDLGHPSP
jgi:hypothetical protein